MLKLNKIIADIEHLERLKSALDGIEPPRPTIFMKETAPGIYTPSHVARPKPIQIAKHLKNVFDRLRDV